MIRILTINIHKGFTVLNRRFVLHELREAIRSTSSDIVFLQEVVGKNSKKAERHPNWPDTSHHEFLADSTWPYYTYGMNAVYSGNHHGNAILSKYPIIYSANIDISTNRIEKRGLLYAIMDIPESPYPLHCICVHLGLTAISRRKQLVMVESFIRSNVQGAAPLVLAGDFNEWRKRKHSPSLAPLGLSDTALQTRGNVARTFPSWLPVLPLDRICTRGMKATHSKIYSRGIWSKLSDHAAYLTEVEIINAMTPDNERAVQSLALK